MAPAMQVLTAKLAKVVLLTLAVVVALNAVGIDLTEHAAMTPAASVSGLYFASPHARYFTVGRLDQDQIAACGQFLLDNVKSNGGFGYGEPTAATPEAGSVATKKGDAFKPKNPGRWKQIRDTIVATTPAGYLGCAHAIQNFDFLPKLPSLKIPSLVVCGDQDPGTPPAGNKKIAELVPGGSYEEIANARHFPNVEQPDVFNRIMMGWLGKHR